MSYSAPEPGSTNEPEPQQPHTRNPSAGQPTVVLQTIGQEPVGQGWGQPQTPEPFVPKKRFKMGRVTQILLAVLLVAVGFFGGVGVTKFMDAGQTRPGRGQFQNLNGGQGRNRQNGAPANGTSPSAVPTAPATAAP
ncbi:hypothetical protein [Pseudarthrobacter sulfonivorans]|uniref:hypothetical protein n=1 Tax=Pseudarthrobacter sulfonivorans TaxID=121292 RepID=UPI00210511D4|nr:hypothetical protein [Pseudarthrobacter sulfonivorans]